MKRLEIALALAGVAVVAAAAGSWWIGLDSERGIQRPTYSRFELDGGAADGSAGPAPNGYIVDSSGKAWILPPMPAEKPMDIHTAANSRTDYAIRSCFWPGPRGRPGVFSNDVASFAVENQFADTATTYVPTALILPAGAKLVLKGEFPHMRHWNLNTYNAKGEAQDALGDFQIEPDPGSSNPFRDGVARDVKDRRYTLTIVSGHKPAGHGPANTLYTNAAPGEQVFLWMRNYVPDHSASYLGGVALPKVELHLANGTVLADQAACDATATPLRGKQVPTSVPPNGWLALARLPWVDRENAGAKDVTAAPLQAYFSRPQAIKSLFAPVLASRSPKLTGGFFNNKATRYGYVYFSRNYGKVYVLTGKMPRTPTTWHGDVSNGGATDMRYMSVCLGGSPGAPLSSDCAYDEQLLPSLDAQGRFYVVISRSEDRPKNATAECGVTWLDMGNGDGVVGGSPDFGLVVNRHTLVRDDFKHSWFAVTKPGQEKAAMGDYLPHLVNMREKAAFEALGCKVDKSRIAALVPR